MTLAKGIGCVLLSVVIVILLPLLLMGGALIAGSERSVFQRAKSPDGWHEARVQFDDGGALSGFERLVLVKSAWNPSDSPMLSCRAFWGHGEAKIDLNWADSSTLVVAHHVSPKNVADYATNCGSVKIVLKPTAPFEDF